MALILMLALAAGFPGDAGEILIPIGLPDRHAGHSLTLTHIGGFGIRRKARATVPSHLHTGIDIRRPRRNYVNEPVYPIARGIVISKRTDGPYAQLIIEHNTEEGRFWSVYEHVAGITVGVASPVDPLVPIARFLNSEELARYGGQFDHLHLEVLREKPISLKPVPRTPERFFSSYSLACTTVSLLNKYFYDPLEFLSKRE